MNSCLDDIINKYIYCRENCSLLFIESLAMNGFIKKAYVEECERKNFKKIVIELINELKITSDCRFEEEVEHSFRVIETYIDFSNKYRSYESLKIVKSKHVEE